MSTRPQRAAARKELARKIEVLLDESVELLLDCDEDACSPALLTERVFMDRATKSLFHAMKWVRE